MNRPISPAPRRSTALVLAALTGLLAASCTPRSALLAPEAGLPVETAAVAPLTPSDAPAATLGARFHLVPGSTLRRTLEAWAAGEGWTVHWATERSYPVQGRADFEGDFVAAAARLIRSFRHLNPPPVGRFYLRNRELRVVTPGDEMGE
jgi:hypothetical protein